VDRLHVKRNEIYLLRIRIERFHATAPKSHFLSPLRWLKRCHIRSQWLAEGTSCKNKNKGIVYVSNS
jgi:hypothetical protein